ncbi:MAG: tyrosine-type recombinase/integrase [Candidatus Dojkabacteria bacterium]|nr:tyrosine-type recombinase/integrase [Candidatus Dojkabacteria bacterium]MDQ7021297.1 tyrosine-type recombinase/integrase [Candidatus Dojkabacteria bacterium]
MIPLEKALKKYEKHLIKEGKSPNTIKAYTRDIKNSFNSALKVDELDQEKIEKFKKELKVNDSARQTIARKLNSIKSFLTYLKENDYISEIPEIDFGSTTVNLRKPKILDRSDYLVLRETAGEDMISYTIIELLLQTGIKIGELAKLKLEDISLLAKPTIDLHDRTIKINSKAKLILKEYIKHYHREKDKTKPLFYTSNGKQIHVRNIRLLIDNIFKKVDLEHYSVNDLRNTFIISQLEAGLSIELVSELVGHKNLLTTKRYLDLLAGKYKRSTLKHPVEI